MENSKNTLCIVVLFVGLFVLAGVIEHRKNVAQLEIIRAEQAKNPPEPEDWKKDSEIRLKELIERYAETQDINDVNNILGTYSSFTIHYRKENHYREDSLSEELVKWQELARPWLEQFTAYYDARWDDETFRQENMNACMNRPKKSGPPCGV